MEDNICHHDKSSSICDGCGQDGVDCLCRSTPEFNRMGIVNARDEPIQLVQLKDGYVLMTKYQYEAVCRSSTLVYTLTIKQVIEMLPRRTKS